MPQHLRDIRRAVVLGVGDNGSGVDAALALAAAGMQVVVTDSRTAAQLPARHLSRLAAAGIPLVAGGNPDWLVDARSLVVPAPSVPPGHPYHARAAAVLNDVSLLILNGSGAFIGVTGSNGKTTTAAWLHHILKVGPSGAALGGNTGTAASRLLSVSRRAASPVVLEISSYQAQYMAAAGAVPGTMVYTNFSPNHLDHHATLDEYRNAKRGLLACMPHTGTLVLNADDEVAEWGRGFPGEVLQFGRAAPGKAQGVFFSDDRIVHRDAAGRETDLGGTHDVPLPGRHNLYNFCAAIAAAAAAGTVPQDAFSRGVGFRGVEHRMEFVAEAGGIAFYDDSASTTPESTLAALQTFTPAPVLIVGGRNKGMPLDELAAGLGKAAAVVLIGETAAELHAAISETAAVTRAQDMQQAVAKALDAAKAAGAKHAVLSPGFASFDMFSSYRERGRAFKDAVRTAARL